MNKVIGIDNSHLNKSSPVDSFRQTQENYSRWSGLVMPDKVLMLCLGLLMLIGLVMVTTASIPLAGQGGGWVFSYLLKQGIYMLLGLLVGFVVYLMPMQFWYKNAKYFVVLAVVLLLLTLLFAREVNGAHRWIRLGPVNLQVSEFVRIAMIVYAAAFLQRYQNQIHKSLPAMFRLLAVLGVIAVLILKQRDFGSAVVISATVLGMMFLAGVCLVRFFACATGVAIIAAMVLIAEPYRVKRLTAYMNPWADMYGDGWQLINSLIAIGRGGISGVGFGESLEKHHYLPEPHTDFIFSILAEEMGLVGVGVLMLLFAVIVWRAFKIANNADKVRMRFASCLAYGVGLWIGMQALINMSVASGLLPTKGLTLPMISYGGSSVLASMILFALLLRVDSESRYTLNNEQRHRRGVAKV
ncbi:MAG: putative lipid II flippase FtsW [Gammaproteobacteria bacterium]|nr:MAG: putative lipid II flippase FtsW [Gammaproteobacteria bacterium]